MRIGSSSFQNNNKTNHELTIYQAENNQLKKLHEERLKRQQQQKNQHLLSQSHEHLELSKQLKFESFSEQTKLPLNIFLNSILSDQRSIKDKPNSIAISSLFQDDPKSFSSKISKNIKGILMTTFGFEMDVLESIALSETPFVVVNDTSEVGDGRVERNYSGYKNMSLVFPPRKNKGYGVFHTKIWVIRFTTFLRVVICTANQHAGDWLVWLNAFWYQDFPLKGKKISDYQQKTKKVQNPKKTVHQKKDQLKNSRNLSSIISLDDSDENQNPAISLQSNNKNFRYQDDFKQTLSLVLKNMFPSDFDLEKEIGVNLENYDFSQVEVVLIPSLPGRFSLKDGEMKKYGMAKVKQIMKQIGPKIKKGSLCYTSSSLGIVQENFLRQVYLSFLPYAQGFTASSFKLIYPSEKYITESTSGQSSVLFLKKQNYYRSQIRKEVFYHYEPSEKNKVSGAIPHLKTVVIQNQLPHSDQEKNFCVFFLGSHNLTKAAWGSYEKNETQLMFSNSELGILFLKMDKKKLLNLLPYRYPPRKYHEYDKPFLRQ